MSCVISIPFHMFPRGWACPLGRGESRKCICGADVDGVCQFATQETDVIVAVMVERGILSELIFTCRLRHRFIA